LDCGSFHKLPGPPRGPGFGKTCVSLVCVRPPPEGPDRVFPVSRPSRGVVSCVALGLPGHPPKGVVPHYPPRGVLRDCSRPVPGSCRGVVSPLTGGFPHLSPTSGPRFAGPGAVSRHPLPRSGGNPVLWLSDSVPLGARSWAPYGGGPTGSPSRGTLGSVP